MNCLDELWAKKLFYVEVLLSCGQLFGALITIFGLLLNSATSQKDNEKMKIKLIQCMWLELKEISAKTSS